jgi:Arc/MetJ family transcription regulator
LPTARVYIYIGYYVHMIKRTTIEIDQELLDRARAALGETTTRGTVERALRLVADSTETDRSRKAVNQVRYLKQLIKRVDISVLVSEEMWQ